MQSSNAFSWGRAFEIAKVMLITLAGPSIGKKATPASLPARTNQGMGHCVVSPSFLEGRYRVTSFSAAPTKGTKNMSIYYFYRHMRSRSIIFLVFLDATAMKSQGTVIMRKVVRITKLADVRSTGFTPMRNA